MKRKNVFLAVLLGIAIAFAGTTAFAALSAVDESFNSSDVDEINRSGPAFTKTKLGTRLRGTLARDVSNYTSSDSGAQTLDCTDAVIYFDTNAAQGTNDPTFCDGQPGQQITFVLVTDNGNTIDITPDTKTGFTSITMSDAKDSCTLRYQDDTVGWVVAGNNGCTIN